MQTKKHNIVGDETHLSQVLTSGWTEFRKPMNRVTYFALQLAGALCGTLVLLAVIGVVAGA